MSTATFDPIVRLLQEGIEFTPETKERVFQATRPALAILAAAAVRGLGASEEDADMLQQSIAATSSNGNIVKNRSIVLAPPLADWDLWVETKRRPPGGKRTTAVLDEVCIRIMPPGGKEISLWISFPNPTTAGGLIEGPPGLQLTVGELHHVKEDAEAVVARLDAARAAKVFSWALPGREKLAYWDVPIRKRAAWATMVDAAFLRDHADQVTHALETLREQGFIDLVRRLGSDDMATPNAGSPNSPHPGSASDPDSERIEHLRELLRSRKQVVLTGPPGTGKTWLANRVAQTYSSAPSAVDTQALWQRYVELATPGMALALALERLGGTARVTEILQEPSVAEYFRATEGDPKNFRNQCHFYLMKYTSPASQIVKRDKEMRSEPYVFDRLPDKRWKLTVTNGASLFDDGDEARGILAQIDAGPASSRGVATATTVTFHPSLSYEDFVEGLRPSLSPVDGGTTLTYRVEPGHFRDAVAQAFANPAVEHLLVIDEINRGNLARIFGELITLLEASKRARLAEPDDGRRRVAEQLVPDPVTRAAWIIPPGASEVRLAYSKIPFIVPENLHVLGTMNSTDRSIALIDFALRRRFYFERLVPDFTLVRDRAAEDGVEALWQPPIRLFEELNRRIELAKDADHALGHSFLLDAYERLQAESDRGVDVRNAVGECLREQVVPLISEYVRGDGTLLARIFGEECRILRNVAPEDEDPDLRLDVSSLTPPELYDAVVESVLPHGGASPSSGP